MIDRSWSRLAVDGHVHIHPTYDEEQFLNAACENLLHHSKEGEFPTLLLTEMARVNVFERWKSGICPWAVQSTNELESIFLDERILVIAGRQIVTKEKIEVLALLTASHFEDGKPLEETLLAVQQSGAIAVLPWGVGKWIGRRGQLVREQLNYSNISLGDNAGRPPGWPKPKIFSQHPTLPGTDPLRLKHENNMVGSYGFFLEGSFSNHHPAADIRKALKRLSASPPALGRRVGFLQFLRQQIGLRIN